MDYEKVIVMPSHQMDLLQMARFANSVFKPMLFKTWNADTLIFSPIRPMYTGECNVYLQRIRMFYCTNKERLYFKPFKYPDSELFLVFGYVGSTELSYGRELLKYLGGYEALLEDVEVGEFGSLKWCLPSKELASLMVEANNTQIEEYHTDTLLQERALTVSENDGVLQVR